MLHNIFGSETDVDVLCANHGHDGSSDPGSDTTSECDAVGMHEL